MTIRVRCTPLLLLASSLLAPALPLAAQAEQGTFVIVAGGRTVGAERWEVRPDAAGTRTTSTVSYLLTPLLALEVSAVYGASDQALQLTRRQGEASAQTFAVQQRNRVTVRRVAPGGEKASEFPGGPDVVLLADSAFAPLLRLLPLATSTPRTVKILYPESGRRGQVRRDAVGRLRGGDCRLEHVAQQATGFIGLHRSSPSQVANFGRCVSRAASSRLLAASSPSYKACTAEPFEVSSSTPSTSNWSVRVSGVLVA